MGKRFLSAGLFVCLSIGLAVSAPVPLKWRTRVGWHRLEGARCTNVRKFVQTRDGYIWMASENGLLRFDGRTFLEFGYQTQPAFHVNDVMDIVLRSDGALWVATMDGLLLYRDNVFTRFDQSDGLPSYEIHCLLLDREDRLWVGTNSGCAVQSGDSFQPVPILPHPTPNPLPVFAMDMLPDGRILSVAGGRLFLVEGDRMVPVSVSGLSGEVLTIRVNGAIDVFAGTSAGLFRIEPRTWQAVRVPGIDVQVETIEVVSGRTILIGTRFQGLVCIQDDQIEYVSEPSGLSNAFVRSLMVDREGTIWVGTSQGVDCLKLLPFKNIGVSAGLLHPHVDAVAACPDGTILIGTQYGVQRLFPDGEIRPTRVSNPVASLCDLPSGGFLAGTMDGSLIFSPDRGRPREWLTGVGLVYMVACGPASGIWVGTRKGLFTAKTIQGSFQQVPELTGSDVRCMAFQNQTVWVGTGKGLYQLENGKVVRQWFRKDGLASDYVFCLLSDEDGTLWIGTDRGLTRLQHGRWTSLDYRHGLPSNSVYGLTGDNRDNLWFSMGEGIGVIPRDRLNREMDAGKMVSMRVYGRLDGLASDGGVGGTQPVVTRSRDGRLWFATGGGVAMVDPEDIPRNRVVPTVVIQDVTVDGRQVDPVGPVILAPGWKRVTVTYAGLSFLVPERVRYRHFLAGYETGWEATGERTVSYTNLDPGDYTFMVHAANDNGVWSVQPATLVIRVLPPWWRTWWFYGLSVILVGVLVNVLFRAGRRAFNMFVQWRRTYLYGPYRVLEVIGKGGMGTVYKVEDSRTGDVLALKVIDPDVTDEDGRIRFEREGLIGERIRHPNVVPVLDRGRSGKTLYYVMDYVEGRRLREIMDDGIGLKTSLAVAAVLMDVARDLHDMGVVHRDLKPENVMIADELNLVGVAASPDPIEALRPHLRILDFGVARLFGATTLTRTGLVTGTLQYVPPEALSGTKHVDAAIDFYAIGVMLYEMVTGFPPYEGDDPGMLMYAILYRSLVSPNQVSVHVPRAVSDLIVRMLEKHREDRLVDYDEIRRELDCLLAGC